MSVIFDGKKFALEKEKKLKKEVKKLIDRGIRPKLVSILVGNDLASLLYVTLKKKAADRVGAGVVIEKFADDTDINDLIQKINQHNYDKNVNGVMVQLPLPDNFSKVDRDRVLTSISPEKDVDGLRSDSQFLTPVVKAVIEVIGEASKWVKPDEKDKVLVVGYSGFEGRKIFKTLKEMGYNVEGADSKTKNLKLRTKNADILISAIGKANIIDGSMVKEGAVVIDIGAPKGDVKTSEIFERAAFISPVPGGIGPMTISCLLENLVDAADGK